VLLDGIETLTGAGARAELVVVAPKSSEVDADAPITWVAPSSVGTDRPFMLYYGDGPAYAMTTAHRPDSDGLRLIDTRDRVLVEHLVFQLQRDLGITGSA